MKLVRGVGVPSVSLQISVKTNSVHRVSSLRPDDFRFYMCYQGRCFLRGRDSQSSWFDSLIVTSDYWTVQGSFGVH